MFAKAELKKCEKIGDSQYSLDFDIQWNGSWKNDINCDGLYVFAKYKEKDVQYSSMILSKSSEGEFDYTAKNPEGCEISDNKLGLYVPDTKLGVFIFPLEKCEDKEQKASVKLTGDGNVSPDDIQLFAVEMVYIPEGGHYIGDPENGISKGGKLKNCFYKYPDKGAYYIGSEDSVKVAEEDDCLFCDFDTENSRQEEVPYEIPAEFPKGFKAMWYMKYSLNNMVYTQFLNCLTRKQQQNHVKSDISGDNIENYYVMTNTNEEFERSPIFCRRNGNGTEEPVEFFTYAPYRCCNGITYADVAAFACFAGLRPITELEFEKAARGPLEAVAGEFAWGTTNIGRVFNFSGVDGSGTEIPVSQNKNDIVNCNFGTGIAPFDRDKKTVPDNPGWIGPVSEGLFERSEIVDGYTKRECTGASYYGVMEMCGNVWELIITSGREEGRKFDGSHGSGVLDENGYHTMSNWPDSITTVGTGKRGGVFVSPNPDYIRMALRVFAAHNKTGRGSHCGLRVGF